MNTDLMFSSKSSDHLTPGWLLDLVEKVAPIGLDPCGHPLAESSRRATHSLILQNPIRPAVRLYKQGEQRNTVSIGTDGLETNWLSELTRFGTNPLVFVNPPYGRALKDWAAKMASENDIAIIALVPARVDTAWWRALDPVVWCALAGRVKFLDDEGKEQDAAPFPSAVCLLHATHLRDRFVEVFQEHGPIYQRLHSASPR